MNAKIKEYLISSANTFITVFLISISSGIDVGHLDKATLVSLSAVALRAAVRATQQYLASQLTK